MPTYSKIILTNTGTQSAIPDSTDLDYGELAINYNDGKLYFKNHINQITTVASSQAIVDAAAHINRTDNPHGVNAAHVGLDRVQNTNDLEKPISNDTQTALDLKADTDSVYTKTETDTEISNATSNKVELTDLSVTQNPASGVGSLSYNSTNGTFDYTPPSLSTLGGIGYGDLSVTQNNPSGVGSLSYNSTNGTFTYAPPNLSLSALGAQGQSDILDDLSALGVVTGEDRFIISTGDGVFAYQTGATVRDSLGLGTDDTPEFNGIDLDGGNLTLDIVGNIKVTTTGVPNQIDFNFDDGDGATESKLSISYSQTADAGGAILPTTTNDIDLGSATNKFKDAYIDGTAYIDSIESDSVVSAGQFGFKGTPVKTVTQQTSITTGVTINSPAGTIECVNHTFASGTSYEFTITNSYVSAEDVIILSFQDGDPYVFANVTDVNAGTFNISLIDIHNQGVTATLKINFAVIEHHQT